jgi:hypothetical protein
LKQPVQSEVTPTHEVAHSDQVVDDRHALAAGHELVHKDEDHKPNVQVDQQRVALLQNVRAVADVDHNKDGGLTKLLH